jgi:hypothetical protein
MATLEAALTGLQLSVIVGYLTATAAIVTAYTAKEQAAGPDSLTVRVAVSAAATVLGGMAGQSWWALQSNRAKVSERVAALTNAVANVQVGPSASAACQ